MEERRLRIGELLIEAGVLNHAKLREALEIQRARPRPLGQILVDAGMITEAQLIQALSRQLSIPWVSLWHVDIPPEVLQLVPRDDAERFRMLPIYVRSVRGEPQALFAAMDDPTNQEALEYLRRVSGMAVRPMIVGPTDLHHAILAFYSAEDEDVDEAAEAPDRPPFPPLAPPAPSRFEGPAPSRFEGPAPSRPVPGRVEGVEGPAFPSPRPPLPPLPADLLEPPEPAEPPDLAEPPEPPEPPLSEEEAAAAAAEPVLLEEPAGDEPEAPPEAVPTAAEAMAAMPEPPASDSDLGLTEAERPIPLHTPPPPVLEETVSVAEPPAGPEPGRPADVAPEGGAAAAVDVAPLLESPSAEPGPAASGQPEAVPPGAAASAEAPAAAAAEPAAAAVAASPEPGPGAALEAAGAAAEPVRPKLRRAISFTFLDGTSIELGDRAARRGEVDTSVAGLVAALRRYAEDPGAPPPHGDRGVSRILAAVIEILAVKGLLRAEELAEALRQMPDER